MSSELLNKAVIVTEYNDKNPLSTLKVVNKTIPALKPNQVLIKVTMRPINPSDVFAVMGQYPGFRPKKLPATPGFEGCGVIADSNSNKGLKNGQRVIVFFDASNDSGSWQEYVIVHKNALLPIPDSITDESACQFFVNPVSVLAMLEELNAPTGSFIVQTAAGSVLGRQFILFAKRQGLKTINLVRRKEQVKEVEAAGGDVVIWTEQPGLDLPAAIRKASGPKGAYGAIDCVGGKITSSLMQGVRNNGTILIYGSMSGLTFEGLVGDSLFRNVTIKGFWLTRWMKEKDQATKTKIFSDLMKLMATGELVPLDGKKFTLDQIHEAYKYSMSEARGGKTLLVSKL